MNLNKKYNFKEGAIEPPFYKSKCDEITHLIEKAVTFNLISIPGVGVTQFFRYYVSNNTDKYNFTFVDSFSLTSYTKNSFFKLLLAELGGESESENDQDLFVACKERLEYLASQSHRVVLVFTRFDKLSGSFDHDFFAHLRYLRNLAPQKIVMIFTANKSLFEVNPQALNGQNLNVFIHNVYFGTYKEVDLRKLAPIYSQLYTTKSQTEVDRAVQLCNGHINLLNLILNSEAGNPNEDRFISIQIKDILDILTYTQLNTVKKIAQGKIVDKVESHLINIGLVIPQKDGTHKLFTPILEDYLNAHTQVRLPAKEGKLFSLLKKNFGRVITKDEIFNHLWADDPDLASDWALNALIYRLKKNSSFKNSGYIIENHKKIGYVLIKN